MKIHQKYKTLLRREGINTPLRLAHFLAQAQHESNFIPSRESMNYRADKLVPLFGRHRITPEQALKFGRRPGQEADQRAIANIVYGGAWGLKNLGNTLPEDGWELRGGGIFQITGRYNLTRLSNATGINYICNPDLLLNEADSMVSAIWFWNDKGLNRYADRDDLRGVTLKVNGGYNGLKERGEHLVSWKRELGV